MEIAFVHSFVKENSMRQRYIKVIHIMSLKIIQFVSSLNLLGPCFLTLAALLESPDAQTLPPAPQINCIEIQGLKCRNHDFLILHVILTDNQVWEPAIVLEDFQ